MSAESYAIVFAALLLLAGRLADLYGARQLFLIGLAVFGLTSLLAALAPGGGLLILARFPQGVGGAMILPTSLALVNAAFSGEARGKAFAVWGSTIGAAAAVGPLLGGWLADFSWRWAFGINIPAVILIAVAVLRYLPASTPVRGRVDIIGALLSICGLGLLSFGLIEGRAHGWLRTTEPLSIAGFDWTVGPSPVAVAFVLSAATLAAFWIRQARLGGTGGEPLMDVKLFGISSFRQGNAVTLLVGLGEFGIIAVLPLWLQFTLGYSALQTGLALLPLAIGSFCASGASFSLTASVSALGQVRIGLALEAVGLVLLGLFAAADSAWWSIAIALFIYGIGIGLATAGLPDQQAEQFGAAITDSAGSAVPALAADPATEPIAAAGREAMSSAVELSSYLCAALLAAALLATLFMRPARATRPD